jgi:hypothetical protein
MAKLRNPRSEFPQPSPSALYMERPASGISAPTRLRTAVEAAMAEASYIGCASMR